MSEQIKTDYHVLGGWLKFIVVAAYISVALLIISGITAVATLVSAINMISRYGNAGLLWGTIIFLVGLIAVFVWYELKFAKMIKERNPLFLQFYHRVSLVVFVISLLGQILLPNAASTSQSVLSFLVGVIIWTVYFVKSERVHVYMGSDEYLWQSRITRKYASRSYEANTGNPSQPSARHDASNVLVSKTARDATAPAISAPASKAAAPAPVYMPVTPVYPLNNCCICGGSLDAGHAVLFTDSYGNEARVDEGCYKAIYALVKSNDRQEVNNAGYFLQSQLPSVSPAVAAYLQNYLNAGTQFLSQPEGTIR